MASNLITAACVMLGVLFACQFLQDAQCLRMDINQHRYTEESAGPVQITCQPDMTDRHEQKDVSVLEIGKEDQRPMAFVSQKSGISYGTVTPTSYQAYGVIGDNGGKTALTVTIPNPTNGDTGAYVCRMYYFDTTGAFMDESVFANLTVKIVDTPVVVKTLLKTIGDLQEQMKDLASKVSDETKALWIKSHVLEERAENQTRMMNDQGERLRELKEVNRNQSMELALMSEEVRELKEVNRNQSMEMALMAEEAAYTISFSASLEKRVNLNAGDVVVFGDVQLNYGNAYDATTGIFTAPRNGVYAFNLVLRVNCDSGCFATAHLKAGDITVASVDARNDYDQAGTSVVCELKKGTKVRAVPWYTSKVYGDTTYRLSSFSGHLVKGL